MAGELYRHVPDQQHENPINQVCKSLQMQVISDKIKTNWNRVISTIPALTKLPDSEAIMAEKSLPNSSSTNQLPASKTPEYNSWCAMKDRASDRRPRVAKYYRDKGITVCDRWANSFENFLADMGTKPGPEYSLDRKDGNKGYSPDNCRWATPTEQNRNRDNARNITIGGETKCLSEWAEQAGLQAPTISFRIASGWPEERWLEPIADSRKDCRGILYSFDGQNLTIKQWARRFGLPCETVRHRVQVLGWSLEESLITEPNKRPRSGGARITAFGKTQNIDQWARETGIAASTIRMRINKRGLDPETALSLPIENRGRSTYRCGSGEKEIQ